MHVHSASLVVPYKNKQRYLILQVEEKQYCMALRLTLEIYGSHWCNVTFEIRIWFIKMVETEAGTKLKMLRTNKGEFMSNEFLHYCKDNGISDCLYTVIKWSS
ncbi:hypothetical protein QVD17_07886 [Tagetes erecta]|uniref:Integrase catalytic domain-containing protein n=1 Tax=Tagetes erecta TaxID=13708 RepID=A0AAD8L3T1_TARER|nr:hypothetical protein QVD17_07886 [Tagetes erecta]